MNDQTVPERPNARRILIVEDDPGARRSLLLLLTGRGFDAAAFPTAAQGLADAAMHPPACLVADYRLAETDGIALLQAMRVSGWMDPAILISAHSSPKLADRATAAGFAVIFDKPLREHALVDAVQRLVRGDG
ncbi:MAG: response regulator [Sphingopyxis sp.]|nr:response regulator [Sphingopyxis sp.]